MFKPKKVFKVIWVISVFVVILGMIVFTIFPLFL